MTDRSSSAAPAPHVRHRDDVTAPFLAPFGEVIAELVGRGADAGATATHSVAQVHAPVGAHSPRHYHRVLEETYYVLSGTARVELDGAPVTLTPGQALLIRPGMVHQLCNDGPGPLELLVVCAPAWTADDSIEV
jgi:mannose-6-phosphate isomerase-like protein (cupin superfamily)